MQIEDLPDVSGVSSFRIVGMTACAGPQSSMQEAPRMALFEVSEPWRFSFHDEEVSLRDLSWPQAIQVYHDADAGHLAGQLDGRCISLEFRANHAAVFYMGPDGVVLRPYFPRRSAVAQDVEPFFCGSCGVLLGDREEFLARFLMSRADGFRLFVAALASPVPPSELPDPCAGQPILPGLTEAVAELAAGRILEWRPLPAGKPHDLDPDAAEG
jgi:hypothetical protein